VLRLSSARVRIGAASPAVRTTRSNQAQQLPFIDGAFLALARYSIRSIYTYTHVIASALSQKRLFWISGCILWLRYCIAWRFTEGDSGPTKKFLLVFLLFVRFYLYDFSLHDLGVCRLRWIQWSAIALSCVQMGLGMCCMIDAIHAYNSAPTKLTRLVYLDIMFLASRTPLSNQDILETGD
jgi:hypothetical protein